MHAIIVSSFKGLLCMPWTDFSKNTKIPAMLLDCSNVSKAYTCQERFFFSI